MPKPTFFNLPGDKRQTVVDAALDEFAQHGYAASNMNRIVVAAGIAKGSFYQYFEDKKDLYFHVIETAGQEKLKAMQPVLDDCADHPLAHNLRAMFRVGLDYAFQNPKMYKVGEDFARNNMSIVNGFIEKYQPQGENIYLRFLESARARGEVDPALNLPLTAGFVGTLISQTSVGVLAQGLSREKMDYMLSEVLDFILRAVAPRPAPPEKGE